MFLMCSGDSYETSVVGVQRVVEDETSGVGSLMKCLITIDLVFRVLF